MADKKPWVEPELIVLVRNKPEEAVLTACKIAGDLRNGPNGWYVMCAYSVVDCSGACNSLSES